MISSSHWKSNFEDFNEKIWAKIIQNTLELNPTVFWAGLHPFIQQCRERATTQNSARDLDGNKRDWIVKLFKILFHEALLRGDADTVQAILQKNPNKPNDAINDRVCYDKEFMQTYIQNHPAQVTLQQFSKVSRLVNQLVDQAIFTQNTANNLTQLISEHFYQMNFLKDDYPPQIQKCLSKNTRTLKELYAELQYQCYPNENLSPFPVQSASYQNWLSNLSLTTEASKALNKKMVFYQDPQRLQDFLNQKHTMIFITLFQTISPEGDYPIAILLGQIHFLDAQNRKENKETLLSEEASKKCIQLLTRFFNLSDQEKIVYRLQADVSTTFITRMDELLELAKTQQDTINNQQEMIETLQEKIAALEKQLHKLKRKLENIPENNSETVATKKMPSIFMHKSFK